MDMTENIDLIIKVGRVAYKVDFEKDDYTSSLESNYRKVAPADTANAWSSYSRLARDEGYHLPVFDVDRPFNTIWPVVHGGLAEYTRDKYVERQTFQDVVAQTFPEATPDWRPSFTAGHYHVYVDYPMLWDEYIKRLEALTGWGIVEAGYTEMARKRKATFVRFPGVPREPRTESSWDKWQRENPTAKPSMLAEWGIDIGTAKEYDYLKQNAMQIIAEERIKLNRPIITNIGV